MAAVSAKILSGADVRYDILPSPSCSVLGLLLPVSSASYRSSCSKVAAVFLSAALVISAVSVPTTSARAEFILSVSEAEVATMSNLITLDNQYIMTSDGLILFVSESNG